MPVDIYAPTPGDALSATELELYHLIMDYRAANGLDAIPLSNLLTATAGRHAQDTLYNIWEPGVNLPDGANLHSWSDAPYYGDHRAPGVMWNAPDRLGLDYPSNGYEISAAGYGNIEAALSGWQGSAGHNQVVLNIGGWSNLDWNAIGIGVEIDPSVGTYGGRIYHVWFGVVEDQTGGPDIEGTSGDETMVGTDFGDRVFDGLGDDTVTLGAGNDYVRVGGGQDSYDGGSGKDFISYYDSTGGITANLEEDTVAGSWASNDTIKDFESISGSGTGGDVIHGTSGSNTIKTYGGNDKVYAGKGTDKVELGDGNDYVQAGGGKENFDGGAGKDYISYYHSTSGVTLNLEEDTASGSWASNDTIKNFESASGSRTGDDDITGTSGSNTFKTYGGDDRVAAGDGTDRVELGSGDDYVRVGGGKNTFDGGSGTDYISYYDSTGGIRIDLRDDEVSGSWAENDTIEDFESASGSKTGDDVMLGTSGANTLRSYGGDDKLYGRSGYDKLVGGDGEDYFDGGHGRDLLYGGADADVFHFDAGEGDDVIKDFQNNVDSIEFDNFGLTKDEIYTLAETVGDDVVFDFGAEGSLTVEDATRGQLFNDFDVV